MRDEREPRLPAERAREVLLVSPPVSPPILNGTVLLARALASRGRAFRYRMLGTRGAADAGAPGVDAIYQTARGDGLADRLRLMWRLVRPDPCALQHFFFAPHRAASQAARAALAVSGKPSVHTIPSQPALAGRTLDSLLFADRTVAVSEATALWLRTAGARDVRVIRPGVAVAAQPEDRAHARARLAALHPRWELGEGPCVLYAGDLEFSDGAEVFVAAARDLAREHADARFLLACRPKTPAAQAVQTRLERGVARSGLSRQIRFVGVVREMGTLCGAADLLVLSVSSLFAKVDMPFVLLEAMALGTPAVVSDLPTLRELAGLGRGVVVVRRSDPGEVAGAVTALLGDTRRLRELGAQARQTIASHFAVERMVDAYEALYREIL